jgi:hypothetical protein
LSISSVFWFGQYPIVALSAMAFDRVQSVATWSAVLAELKSQGVVPSSTSSLPAFEDTSAVAFLAVIIRYTATRW